MKYQVFFKPIDQEACQVSSWILAYYPYSDSTPHVLLERSSYRMFKQALEHLVIVNSNLAYVSTKSKEKTLNKELFKIPVVVANTIEETLSQLKVLEVLEVIKTSSA